MSKFGVMYIEARLTALFILFFFFGTAHAQSKGEVDDFFERMSAKLTVERKKHSNEINDVLRVEYNRARTELRYFYATRVLAKNGLAEFSKDDILLTRVSLVNSACSSLGAFMRVHNLRVIHTYYDERTQKEVMKIEITKRDC